MLRHLRFGRSKWFVRAKSLARAPSPDPQPYQMMRHCICLSDQHSNSHTLRASYILDTSRSLPPCCYCRRAQISVPLRQHSDFAVSGQKFAFRSDFGVHQTSSMLILLPYTRRSPSLQLYGPLVFLCTVSLL